MSVFFRNRSGRAMPLPPTHHNIDGNAGKMWIIWIAVVSLLLMTASIRAQRITPPEKFLGHQVGADYKLASYDRIHEYFLHVADNSDRVNVRSLGESTEGRDMILAEITDSATERHLDRQRANRLKIADPRRIGQRSRWKAKILWRFYSSS